MHREYGSFKLKGQPITREEAGREKRRADHDSHRGLPFMYRLMACY